MLPETQQLLDNFYSPFNKELAELMNDERFLFERSARPNDKIADQVDLNNDSFEEQPDDNEKVKEDFDHDLEYSLDLSDEDVIKRFRNRNDLYHRECAMKSKFVSKVDLNFTIAHLTNVFYDDKYKLIMCAVPKAATSNWQRVLAVLKYDGTRQPESFQNGNLYNQLNRFSMLAKTRYNIEGSLER